MRQIIALLTLALAAVAPSAPAFAHDVKDPVCRMTVDSDTTKWTHKLGNRSFYFCSSACVTKFKTAPGKYEKLAGQLEKGDLHDYAVELTTSPNPVAGKPVELAFAVKYKETGKLVSEFELIHEKLFHLVMVTSDLRWFEHQHAVRGADGVFRKTWTFPVPGKYVLYADFTPSDGDNQVVPLPLTVGGGIARSFPLTPDRARVKEVAGYRAELAVHGGPLRMEKQAVLTYVIKDRKGRPVRDLQPFIGAAGHLLAISADGKEMVHTHAVGPTQAGGMESGAVRLTKAMATEKGPALSFKLTLPTGGVYKVWAQFLHRNRVLTVPFTLYAQDLWTKAAAASTGLTCPVMKNPIPNPATAPRLLVNGKPVLFCCAGCSDDVKKTPAKYLKAQVKDPITGKPFRVTASTPKLERGGALFLFSGPRTREQFQAKRNR